MLTVFYGEQVWGTYKAANDAHFELMDHPEVRNGCFIYWPSRTADTAFWYRGDFIPCLLEDVPPVLRTMMLLLGE